MAVTYKDSMYLKDIGVTYIKLSINLFYNKSKDGLNRWKGTACSWIRRHNIVKLLYRLNTTLSESQWLFFVETDKCILKFIQKLRGTGIGLVPVQHSCSRVKAGPINSLFWSYSCHYLGKAFLRIKSTNETKWAVRNREREMEIELISL